MSHRNDASQSIPAFKEWQVVCSALGSGEQILILRKGGIAEGRDGFRWLHRGFLLFPTQFHQQTEGVRGDRSVIPSGDDQSLCLDLWIDTVATARICDWSLVERFSPYHIWTEEVVRERFEWGDEPGLSVALVRARRLATPWRLGEANRKAFGGCRSWLDLPLSEWSPEHAQHLSSAEFVVGDDEFEQRSAAVRELLSVTAD